MEISVNEDYSIQLRKVYNSVVLQTDSNETMTICMRDTGFEFRYEGVWYSAQKGKIEKMNIQPRETSDVKD